MTGLIRWIAIAALLAVGLGAVFVSTVGLGGTQAATTQYLTQAALLSTVANTSAATGTVASAEDYALRFGADPQVGSEGNSGDSSGTWTVDTVLVSVGDLVSAGQPLAMADTVDIESEIAVATSSLELAQMKLADAEQAFKDAKTDAKRELVDVKAAIDAAALAVKNAEVQKADAEDLGGNTLRTAKIKLIQAQDQLRELKRQRNDLEEILDEGEFPDQTIAIAEAEEAVAELEAELIELDERLELSRIVAPASGVVTAVSITPGFVAPSGTAIEMASDTLQVIADVVESDIASMAPGQTATVNIAALGQGVTGVVTSVAPTTEGDTDSVVTYPVTVTLEDPDPMVMSGMSTDVEITIAEAADVVAVPAVALNGRALDRSVQILLPDGSVEQRSVTVGLVNETLAEIQSGIAPGEEVIVGTVSERVEAEGAASGLVGDSNIPGQRALQGGGRPPGAPSR